ncbi:3-hydroxyacyl-CoA dehydrogenase family protein [Oleisolibacter albus]|uniref:3-hydroxyacyl-CoA dehydrogenase family protein n=1 Tax=Oleisolibacter albus TaxID=2171757 RepID=UPI000DF473EE|nr:3-hydroxyacyl-CoA dehydrogenase NAD-binding domain-containing protein [Oleisolibacter albus]
MTKERIAVIGGGMMGQGIAQVFAVAGHQVRICEPDAARRDGIINAIRKNLGDGQAGAADRISPCAELAETVRDADAVFECVFENLELKQSLFAQIEAACPPTALLASNTSVIPITRIVERVKGRARAMGTHWWNPPDLVPLVEVIQTDGSGEAELEHMVDLLRRAGKTPVRVKKDVPGFVGNRLQHALWREAIALVQNGVCDAETVDLVIKASFGRRLAVLGPLENADLVGTDLTLAIHEQVLFDLDRTAEPLPYLRELVASGRLGMKSGEGFRRWTPEQAAALRARVSEHLKRLNAAERG